MLSEPERLQLSSLWLLRKSKLETWSEYDVGFFLSSKELLSFGYAYVIGKLLDTEPGLFLAG